MSKRMTKAQRKKQEASEKAMGALAGVGASIGLQSRGMAHATSKKTSKRDAALMKDPAFRKAIEKMSDDFKRSGGTIKTDAANAAGANYASKGWQSKAIAGHAGGNVNSPKNRPSILLHELGHSTAQSAKPKTRAAKLLNKLRSANAKYLYPAGKLVGMGGGAVYAGLSDDPDKAAKRGAMIGAAGSAPVLAEEAAANVQAGKQIYRSAGGGKAGRKAVMKFLSNIKGAQGTYVAAAAAAILTPYAIGKSREATKEASVRYDLFIKLAEPSKKKKVKKYTASRFFTSPEAALGASAVQGPIGIAKSFGLSAIGREAYLRGALHRAAKGKKSFGKNDAKLLKALKGAKKDKDMKGGAFAAAVTDPKIRAGTDAVIGGGVAYGAGKKLPKLLKSKAVVEGLKSKGMPAAEAKKVTKEMSEAASKFLKKPKALAAIVGGTAALVGTGSYLGKKLNAYMQSRAVRGRANIERSGGKLTGLKPSKAHRRALEALKKSKID